MSSPSLNKEALRGHVKDILLDYRHLLDGAEEDVRLFAERAAVAVSEAVASGDRAAAEEVAGAMRALAWASKVQLDRTNALAFRKVVLLIIRSAVAVVVSL